MVHRVLTFVVLGAPRTKKNSLRIMRARSGRRFVAQSSESVAWEQAAALQLRQQFTRQRYDSDLTPIADPVNMRALVYRARAGKADLLNYLAAISDAIEAAGVVVDDTLVAGVDGSRLFIDRERPRVEIEISRLVVPREALTDVAAPG